MHHQALAANLSHAQREMLISLIDGPLPFVACLPRSTEGTRRSLFRLGLVRMSGAVPCSHGKDFFALTDDGRQVVCAILADCAEMLIRAQSSTYAQVRNLLANIAYGFPADHRKPTDDRPQQKDRLLDSLRAYGPALRV